MNRFPIYFWPRPIIISHYVMNDEYYKIQMVEIKYQSECVLNVAFGCNNNKTPNGRAHECFALQLIHSDRCTTLLYSICCMLPTITLIGFYLFFLEENRIWLHCVLCHSNVVGPQFH